MSDVWLGCDFSGWNLWVETKCWFGPGKNDLPPAVLERKDQTSNTNCWGDALLAGGRL